MQPQVPPSPPAPPGYPPGYPPQFTPPPAGSYAAGPPRPTTPQPSGEAIAALVCGLMAWSCFPLGFVAIWLGARARRLARENPQTHGGEGLALAGMITGGIIGGLMLLFWLAYFGFFAIVFGIGLTAGP
ncbi:MAG: DUF4190 domain-containing protein [Myxococcales bacterium]|nr:DUF4190 domain-containing protein [Myxococcales bacterium]MCB9580252.1 DUF4190 domain-containing protein [Polyangiaceae bacterium]